MPSITLNFASQVNTSLQVGDIVYYCNPSVVGGFNTSPNLDDLIKMGDCTSVTSTAVVVNCADNITLPDTTNDFILFSKDNSVNLSSIIGYYAEVKFVNNSTEPAELFSMGLDTIESSK
jgi:hypothetical protein